MFMGIVFTPFYVMEKHIFSTGRKGEGCGKGCIPSSQVYLSVIHVAFSVL